MKKVFALLIVTLLCAVMTLPFPVHGQNSDRNPARRATDAPVAQNGASDDRYIVKFHKLGFYTSAEMRAEGAEVVHEFPELGAVAARLPEKALRAMLKNPAVQLIEPDPRRYPMALSDTVLPSGETLPYGIQMVQANLLTDANAANRRVCIIDSGYYRGHDDLQDGSVTASPDPGTGDPFTDRSSHGTHVAGTIAAIGGNSTGVVGVLPGSRINLHIVKVFGDDGNWAYSSDLAAAVQKCRDAGSNVISMSLGVGSSNSVEQAAFDRGTGL